MRDTLKEALTSTEKGPKVIVASSECMLNKQRRIKPLFNKAVKGGERVVRERFGVDEDVCTGDHACIRLSGCPSLSVKHTERSAQGRSGRRDRQQLRRLRQLRRGRGGGRAVPVVLPRRHHPQPDRLRPVHGEGCAAASSASCSAAATGAASPWFESTRMNIMLKPLRHRSDQTALHRRAGDGRPGRRRAGRLDRGAGGKPGLDRAVDLGAGRRPAHRRDHLLCRDDPCPSAACPIRCCR